MLTMLISFLTNEKVDTNTHSNNRESALKCMRISILGILSWLLNEFSIIIDSELIPLMKYWKVCQHALNTVQSFNTF